MKDNKELGKLLDLFDDIAEEQTAKDRERLKATRANDVEALKINDLYEYDVDVVYDDINGSEDFPNLILSLTEHSTKGWRLKGIINNELGKNSESFHYKGFGSGTNSTIEQTVLIYERLLKKN